MSAENLAVDPCGNALDAALREHLAGAQPFREQDVLDSVEATLESVEVIGVGEGFLVMASGGPHQAAQEPQLAALKIPVGVVEEIVDLWTHRGEQGP